MQNQISGESGYVENMGTHDIGMLSDQLPQTSVQETAAAQYDNNHAALLSAEQINIDQSILKEQVLVRDFLLCS